MSKISPWRLAYIVFLLTVLKPSEGFSHPTNGYLCTEIETPGACFDSEGFCEWVRGQCLYRCDIHQGFEDCGKIKAGCSWDGEFCIPAPLSTDQGLVPRDASVQDADSNSDSIARNPSDTPKVSLQSDWMLGSSMDTTPETSESIEATSPSGCRVDRRGPFEKLLLVFIPIVWRRRKC